jgi:type VI protein secretion system component Hcp
MANDVYVKFGECEAQGGPLNTKLPDIEGDSTDALHFWWCELRECGFDMETPQQAEGEDGQDGDGSSGGSSSSTSSSKSKPASGFKTVRLRKRVDWASPQLFLKCCQAAMATTTKSTDDDGAGRIDKVTVEVCRPTSSDQVFVLNDGTTATINKIPCARVEYKGVRIIRYELSMNGPEPAESITFEFDSLKYTYVQLDPQTGNVIDQSGLKTSWLENHHPEARTSGNDNTSSNGGSSGTSSGGGGGGSGGNSTPSPAMAPATAGGAPPAPGSAPDATISVNFPGLWQGTGFGLLPD